MSDDELFAILSEIADEEIMAKNRASIIEVGRRIIGLAANGAEPDLQIGVGVTDNIATVIVMQPHSDGSVTVIYSGTHPTGDSTAQIKLAAPVADSAMHPELSTETVDRAVHSALAKDAERYRYLRDINNSDAQTLVEMKHGKQLDATIDAVIKEKQVENIVQSQEQKPQIDDGGPVGLYPAVRSQGKNAFDVLGELAEQEQLARAKMAEKAREIPLMPVVESMTQTVDRPENWAFKEWVNWHHANATPHEKYLMLSAWKVANGPKDGLTGDQLYAITQLYNAIKDSSIEYHDNSNLATAMRTIVGWFRT